MTLGIPFGLNWESGGGGGEPLAVPPDGKLEVAGGDSLDLEVLQSGPFSTQQPLGSLEEKWATKLQGWVLWRRKKSVTPIKTSKNC